jgi:ABC-2 type transport system ATP-binding protein
VRSPAAPPVASFPAGDASFTVRLDGVSVFYGEVVGLSHVTLGLAPGITGIVGPNGSGKTTLMRAITGLLPPLEGSVHVLGGDPFLDASVRTRIAFVSANPTFFDSLTSRKNLYVALLAKGFSRVAAREAAARALETAQLTGDGDRPYGILSRGMRQRVKLGLVFVTESPLVLLDEPFLGVDPPNRLRLKEAIHRLGEMGRTVLISSHVLHEVESLTDRVGVLAHGRLLGMGSIHSLLEDLRDRHPHRIQLVTPEPRRLGSILLGRPHVRELRITGKERLEFLTDHPEAAYAELPTLVVASGAPVSRVVTLDGGLEAVFTRVTETGTRRL